LSYTDNGIHFFQLPTGEDEIPELPVERDLLDRLKARIELARQIDRMQHEVAKEHHDKKWLNETAEAMEIELDEDMLRCVLAGSC
jgi:ATP-dependent RNA helicase DDX24/MAK5